MAYRVIISEEAKSDVKDIFDKIAYLLCAPIAASRQFNRILDAIDSLKIFPNRFAVLDFEEEDLKEIRRMLVDKYSVFYRVDEKEKLVSVLMVVYSASDFKTKLIKYMGDG